jgi:hypothetical protein
MVDMNDILYTVVWQHFYFSGQIGLHTGIWAQGVISELMKDSPEDNTIHISRTSSDTNNTIIIYDITVNKTSSEYIEQYESEFLTEIDKKLMEWFNDGG